MKLDADIEKDLNRHLQAISDVTKTFVKVIDAMPKPDNLLPAGTYALTRYMEAMHWAMQLAKDGANYQQDIRDEIRQLKRV